jgi:hypothetical protein
MNGTPIIAISVVAIILSAVAVTSAVVLKPTATIGAGAVGENELANNSVTGDKIASGTITDTNIASAGVSKIANNAVGSGQIADNSVTLQDLNSAVAAMISGLENIADNSITSAKIADGAVTLSKLAAGVLAMIPTLPITTGNIADNSVTGAKIADGTIDNADIAAGANINPSKISGTAWTSTNDGSGSGLDADTLDGLQGTQLLRNDTSDTINGNLVVNGSITQQTENRYYTIPFCAFVGETNSTPYSYSLYDLMNTDPAFNHQNYYAPINLPDGARITKVAVFYYRSADADSAYAYIDREDTASWTVATISLPQTGGSFTTYESPVTETVVSNNRAYWVRLYLDPHDSALDIQVGWVCIKYTVTKPLP